MRHANRHGFTLIQALGYLALLGTALTLGTMLLVHVMKFSGQEQRRQEAEAAMRKAIEHFHRDVRRAEHFDEATFGTDRLVLHAADAVMVYQWSPPKLTRTFEPTDGETVTYEWEWASLKPEFAVEPFDRGERVFWLKFTATQWDPESRLMPTGLTAAARLAGGSS